MRTYTTPQRNLTEGDRVDGRVKRRVKEHNSECSESAAQILSSVPPSCPSLESERTSMLCTSYIIHTAQTHRFTQVQDTHQPAHTCLGLHSLPRCIDTAALLPCGALFAISMSSHPPADAWSPLTRWLTCQSSLPQGTPGPVPWPGPLVKCSHSTMCLPHCFWCFL